jgi:hypothetical protein
VPHQVLAFYEGMGMALREKPPLMLVDSAALGEAETREQRSNGPPGAAAPVFHTRGLTLSQVSIHPLVQLLFAGNFLCSKPGNFRLRVS